MGSHNLVFGRLKNDLMLLNESEYQAMYQTEDQLWWYRHLHDRVVDVLHQGAVPTSAHILDAGCGTGGMLARLHQAGYQNLHGFDFNPTAVELAQNRAVGVVERGDILKVKDRFPPASFDVIISNDVWYQFEDAQLLPMLDDLVRLLTPGGILISNNQAFKSFRGMHDVAVGAKRRFHPTFFHQWLYQRPFLSGHWVLWSQWLAPLIWAIRSMQRFQLKWKLYSEIKSDVSMPSPAVNWLFYQLVSLEKRLMPRQGGWGSSLFLVVKKEK